MWFDWSHFTTSSVFLCFFVSPSDIGWDEAGDEAHKDWQETDWLQFHRWTTTTGVSRVFVMYVTHAAIKLHHHVPLVTMKLEIKKTWSALFTLSGNLMQLMQWEKVFPSALKFSLYTSIGHKKQHRREDYRIMTGWQTVTLWVFWTPAGLSHCLAHQPVQSAAAVFDHPWQTLRDPLMPRVSPVHRKLLLYV